MNTKIQAINFSDKQKKALNELCNQLKLELCDTADIKLYVCAGSELSICKNENEITITYRKPHELFRAISYLGDVLKDGKEIHETGAYKTLCYMADNSRNAVYNLSTAKQMIRYLALAGYNSMMLYTEDTYEIPEYPYFGHMRGRFTEAELKEIDDYADLFDMELIPCIQTLAHLKTTLRWPDFDGYKDSEDILMVGDERTYKLVDAMIRQCRKCFRSKRINLGMDEAHMLGLGKYLKKNGYRKSSDVMLEHLEYVVKICTDYDFAPMIWSDMFFRMAFNTYYVREGSIPAEVIRKVPNGLTLIYWDYYTTDVQRFHHMLECHKQFDNPIAFAGGAWKWGQFGAHNFFSLNSTKMHLDECAKFGIDDIIVTSWGDDGGEASQFSTLPTLLYFAERCYNTQVDSACLNRRALQCFGISFDDLLAFDIPDAVPENTPENMINHLDPSMSNPADPSKYLLYNDPLERLMDCHFNRENASAYYAQGAEKLLSLASHEVFGYAFEALGILCKILTVKCDMGVRLYDAYHASDRTAIEQIANTDIPQVIAGVDDFIVAFRKQWYKENKTFGFTPQEIRLGGLKERLRSIQLRLNDYLNGDIHCIEELEAPALSVMKNKDGEYIRFHFWKDIVRAGLM